MSKSKSLQGPWTFTYAANGYRLYLDGVAKDGVTTLGTPTHNADGTRRHWQHTRDNLDMFRAAAAKECDKRNRDLVAKAVQQAAAEVLACE